MKKTSTLVIAFLLVIALAYTSALLTKNEFPLVIELEDSIVPISFNMAENTGDVSPTSTSLQSSPEDSSFNAAPESNEATAKQSNEIIYTPAATSTPAPEAKQSEPTSNRDEAATDQSSETTHAPATTDAPTPEAKQSEPSPNRDEAATDQSSETTHDPAAAGTPTPAIFSIRFFAEGTETVVNVVEGEIIEMPSATPSKSGHVFLYWYNQAETNPKEFTFGVKANSDLVLQAKFSPAEIDSDLQGDPDTHVEPTVETTSNKENGSLPTPTPNATDKPTQTEQPAGDNLSQSAAHAEPSVSIHSTLGETVNFGDTIYLTSVLVGLDGVDVAYQWQYSTGNAWMDVPGATGSSHSYVIDEETINYVWSVCVTLAEKDRS